MKEEQLYCNCHKFSQFCCWALLIDLEVLRKGQWASDNPNNSGWGLQRCSMNWGDVFFFSKMLMQNLRSNHSQNFEELNSWIWIDSFQYPTICSPCTCLLEAINTWWQLIDAPIWSPVEIGPCKLNAQTIWCVIVTTGCPASGETGSYSWLCCWFSPSVWYLDLGSGFSL